MARKAVAATLASLLLFTALVVADSTMMAAEENLASSTQMSHVEVRELTLSQYSAAATAMDALATIQAHVSSDPADCASLPQYLDSISASGSSSGGDAGISYSSNVTLVPAIETSQAAQSDNLTVLYPFSGYSPGALNFQASIYTKAQGGGGSVSMARHELHVLNLPISPGSASFLCASALGSLASALSGASCNATSAASAVDSAMPALVVEAAARGFVLTAGWALGADCSATYWVTLVELGVEGVTGRFDWTVRGSGATA